jgi:two-component system, OmpR family, alkaline phosphatase synthesis response regulator PhoP
VKQERSILIIEDEKNLGTTLSEYLTTLNLDTHLATTAKEAKAKFLELNPAIVLMDIGLPDGNGLELARSFRQHSKNFVLLFLSAQNDPETRVQGLEIGAQDYITKPFALKELTLRLERLLKSKESFELDPEEIVHGNLKIWFRRFEVQDAHGTIVNLSQKECAILHLLYQKQGEAVDRDEILDRIWGSDKFPSHRTIDNYIVKLRKWTETDANSPITIQSIRAIGYKLSLKEI